MPNAPTPEENDFLPILFAFGAADDGVKPSYLSREVAYSMLAMDSFALSSSA